MMLPKILSPFRLFYKELIVDERTKKVAPMSKALRILVVSMLHSGIAQGEHASFKNLAPFLAQAKALETHRYQSPKGFLDTIKELKRHIGAKNLQPTSEMINLPHVRTCTLHLTDSVLGASSINIYLNSKTGITEFFLMGPSP